MTIAPKPIAPGVNKSVPVTVAIADTAPQPNGLPVTLSGIDAKIATAPASVTIPAGQNQVTFNVTGVAVGNTSITANANGHSPSTADINVRQNQIILPPSVLVAPGSSVQFTVTSSDPAPSGGLSVSLSTLDPSIGTVSSSVVIAEGATSATATANGLVKGTTTISASAPNFNGTSSVLAVKSIAISFNPAGSVSVPSTTSVNRAVHLSDAAPPGGLSVSLQTADSSIASVSPSSVTVPEGQADSPTFAVNGLKPNTNTTLTASAAGATSGSVTVFVGPAPAISQMFGFSGNTVAAGMQRQGFEVSLNAPAPDNPPGSGGLVVTLSSADTSKVTVQNQVVVPTGNMGAVFTIAGVASTRDPSGADHPVTVSATAPGFTGNTIQISVATEQLVLSGVQTSRTTSSSPQAISGSVVNSGCQFCGDVLTKPLTVTFAATDPATNQTSSIVSVSPPQVTIGAGQNCTCSVQSVSVGTPTAPGQYVVTLSAPGIPTVSSSTVTVTQTAISQLFGFSGNTVAVGMQRNGFEVVLDSPAPDLPVGSGGMLIKLSSADSTKVQVPSQIIIPTGNTGAIFTIAGLAPTADPAGDHPVTVTATAGNSSKTIQISVATEQLVLSGVATSRTTSSSPQTISGSVVNSGCQFCGDVLTKPLTVTLAATDPATNQTSSIVSVTPTQVTIGAGQNCTCSVQSVSVGTPTASGQYVVTLSAPGIPTVSSSTVTVTQTAISQLFGFSGNTVAVGMQRNGFEVVLDSPAPDLPAGSGGMVINLSSGDTTKVQVPNQVTVPTGNTGVVFTITGVAATADTSGDHPVTVTATVGNSSKSIQISVAAEKLVLSGVQTSETTFSSPETISGSVVNSGCQFCGDVLTKPLTVTFAAIDPATNQTSSIVSVSPTQVTIAAGQSCTCSVQNVTIGTPTAPGQYAITLAAPNIPTLTSATVTVTEPKITNLTSFSNNTVAAGMQRTFFVSLDSPAPQDTVINLGSSDNALVTVPPTVTIPAHQSSASFAISGVAVPAGQASGSVDVSASAPGITGLKVQISVVQPVLFLSAGGLPHTTAASPISISGFVLNSGCQFCGDVLTSPVTVSFTGIDPNTGGLSTIVSVSPSQVTIPAGSNSTGNVTQVQVGTPSATGSYQIQLSAPNFTSVSSSVVTVTLPSITFLGGTQANPVQVGSGMHREFIPINLDSPAPKGGLAVTLTSSDPSKVTVPQQIVIPAGNFGGNYTVTGIASTHDSQGVDHPVSVTASASGWIGTSTPVSVSDPILQINGLATQRTVQSQPNQISISVINPGCNCGDVLNAQLSTINLSIQSTTNNIATVSPTTVSIAANSSTSGSASISTPTASGTYTLEVSAQGFTNVVSTVVTVQ